MDSSIPLRSGPLQETSTQEPEIGSVEVPDDERDHTGRKRMPDSLMR
jgi:hypothetical protein